MPKAKPLGRIHSKSAASSARASPLLSKEVSKTHVDELTAKQAGLEELEDEEKNSNPLSRGQRKRLAKRGQYAKREKMILSSLRLQRVEDQKRRIDGMDALKEALNEAMTPNTNPTSPSTIKVTSHNSKRTVAHKEIEQMHLVLQHPSFVASPFVTMQEHLRNTFSRQATELQRKAEEARTIEKNETLQRKELRKERIRDAKFQSAQSRFKRRRT